MPQPMPKYPNEYDSIKSHDKQSMYGEFVLRDFQASVSCNSNENLSIQCHTITITIWCTWFMVYGKKDADMRKTP